MPMLRVATCVMVLGLWGVSHAGKKAALPPQLDAGHLRALLSMKPTRFLGAKKQWMQLARALLPDLGGLLGTCRPPECTPPDGLQDQLTQAALAPWKVASATPPSEEDGVRSFVVAIQAGPAHLRLRCADAATPPSLSCSLAIREGDRPLVEYTRTLLPSPRVEVRGADDAVILARDLP